MQLDDIHTAHDFLAFMNEVWSTETIPLPDGGMLIKSSLLYDQFHHARRTAQAAGAKRTGGGRLGGENADIYRWPDGTGAAIAASGGAVQLVRPRP